MLIIPYLSLLPLLIWTTDYIPFIFNIFKPGRIGTAPAGPLLVGGSEEQLFQLFQLVIKYN